jgi:hypothetical protein
MWLALGGDTSLVVRVVTMRVVMMRVVTMRVVTMRVITMRVVIVILVASSAIATLTAINPIHYVMAATAMALASYAAISNTTIMTNT